MNTMSMEDQETLIEKDPSLYNEDLAPLNKERCHAKLVDTGGLPREERAVWRAARSR